MKSSEHQNITLFFSTQNVGRPIHYEAVSGGSINNAYRIQSTAGTFFLKTNDATRFSGMFEAEVRGLKLLRESAFTVPKPIAADNIGNTQFLLMEWVEQGAPSADFWDGFGQKLAQLHSITADSFGLNHDNYIGSLPQRNTETLSWPEFYRNNRLLPQIELAAKNNRLTPRMKQGFNALFHELESLFPTEKPSLVHGDLWSGNLMVAEDGSPCIFDPAVYYGHREMDLAMMALFGGFGTAWETAYSRVCPLEKGWRGRIEIGQLYPLMVHVNLFGGGYAYDVERILARFL